MRFKLQHVVYAIVVLLLAATGTLRGCQSPRTRAVAECVPCGLSELEVDELIRTMAESEQSRSELLRSFSDTFQDGESPELCMECTGAILDAAQKRGE